MTVDLPSDDDPDPDDPDPDITRRFHGGDAFSAAARPSAERRSQDQTRILVNIRRVGPSTCEEVRERLDLPHQTASARISELRASDPPGLVTVGRRSTRSGRTARVHGIPGLHTGPSDPPPAWFGGAR